MAGYKPTKITGMQTGLVQSREEFILPDDAYPTLQNAYVWRERIKRKKGYQLVGRLQRAVIVSVNLSTDTGQSINLISALSLEPTATIVPGSLNLHGNTDLSTFTDTLLNGTLTITGGSASNATINYATGLLFIDAGGFQLMTGTIEYYPGLPVMGLRLRDATNATFFQTVAFDQKYAYVFNGTTWQEFIQNTTWNANNSAVNGVNFFWTTNYWIGDGNQKIFWATNSGLAAGTASGDPIRYTNGTNWADFAPAITTGGSPILLNQCLALTPFRGRMVAFNTWEGTDLASSSNFSNRIRWAAIGTPFTTTSSVVSVPGNINATAWRDDIRGQGGFLDIPTSEDIISIGFVRDNLVIYCERSTWQLRYTGRSISPFQIEKVNSENGAESTFSAVQFDTSLIGIGDKGILECDSYKSQLIDIKIPDFVFQFNSANNGSLRIQGVRDFINRLSFWTIPTAQANGIFPDQRLVYNYENDSWALFNDSLTALGTLQIPTSRTWLNTHQPWIECNFPWITQPAADPTIIGGNQQGYVEYLDELTTNDVSLFISAITVNGSGQTIITSPNHNMQTGFVIGITDIPSSTPYASLNGGVYGVVVLTANTFIISTYNVSTDQFTDNVNPIDTGTYVGSGQINIRENFSIISKKFNFLDEGQSIQMGYIDILMNSTQQDNPGAISLNVFADYNQEQTTNTLPQNAYKDTFFNSSIPTTAANTLNNIGGTKFWQRVVCPTRANFITLQYFLSNAQMAGPEQELDVQIDAQVLWMRQGGRMTQF